MKRIFRISIRTLLVVVALTAIWMAHHVNRASSQRRAVATIRDAGGAIYYDWMLQPVYDPDGTIPYFKVIKDPDVIDAPTWLREAIGDDYFQHVVQIGSIHPHRINDDVISAMRKLKRLEEVNLKSDPPDGPTLEGSRLRDLKAKIEEECGVKVFGPFS